MNLVPYKSIMKDSLIYVIRESLRYIQGRDSIYPNSMLITVNTQYKGNIIHEELVTQYPHQITIILQHRFWDLEVYDENFRVTLDFDSSKIPLTIFYKSIFRFVDTYANFLLDLSIYEKDFDRNEKQTSVDDDNTIKNIEQNNIVHLKDYLDKKS